MRKKLRLAAIVLLGVLALIAAGVVAVWEALRYEPDFYRRAIHADPIRQRQASDEMLRQSGALLSDVRNKDRWEVLFTAEQINGWLAVDLVENHADALPESIRDPRLAIEPDRMTLACRFQRGNITTVFTLIVQPFLAEPNVLGLRIRRARAGLLPWPLSEITGGISEAAGREDLHLRWLQAQGDPVALISIPPFQNEENGKLIQIKTLRLGQGEIYLAGTARPAGG